MATRKDIENSPLHNSQDLCALVEKVGYNDHNFRQLINNNGSAVSSLTDFFDDNPGAMEAVQEWILENVDLEEDSEEDDFDDEVEEEENE